MRVSATLRTFWLLAREDRPRAALAFLLVFAGPLSGPGVAVAMAGLTNAAVAGEARTAALDGAAVGVLTVVLLTAGHFAHTIMSVLGERAAVAIDRDLVTVVQGPPGTSHLEDPEYADRLQLLREHVGALAFTVAGAAGAAATVLQIAVSIALLGGLDPALTVLPLIAVAPLLANRRAHRLQSTARLRVAPHRRQAHAVLDMAYQQGAAMEVRLAGLREELRRRQRAAFDRAASELTSAELRGAVWSAAGQVFFALAYALALVLVVHDVVAGHGSVGDVVLAIVLARQINTGVGQILTLARAVQDAALLGGYWNWLRERARAADRAGGAAPAPAALVRGISIRELRFRYPGARADALSGLSLDLAAGTVVAVVGENGAGKTTLVKLLCRFHEPTAGTIVVDGTPLADIDPRAWQGTLTAAFQDFVRFEVPALESIGIGWRPAAGDRGAVLAAARRAGAAALVEGLPHGLDTELGTSFPHGTGLSSGQWQQIALARAAMPPGPLLVVLDEPSAALDAAAEHALFERHSELARSASTTGAITLLISHRFSTVSMADLIVVLDRGRVVEQGTHTELLAAGGRYAELFELQAGRYRESPAGPVVPGE